MRKFLIVSMVVVLSSLIMGAGCFVSNLPPIITSDPVKTATVGVEYTYNVNAADPEGDVLTYYLTAYPNGMNINSATGLIKWIPAIEGDYAVVVKVSDGDLNITQSFVIEVSEFPPVNQAPVIMSTPVTTATVGVVYTYNVNATDPEGDTLTYSLAVKPGGMTISSASGLIMWTPIVKGNYAVVVNVSDGVLSDTQGFTIVVSKPTVPPETYTITASASPGGSISPLGDVTVDKGSDIPFTITPNTNYNIADVLADGISVGAVGTHTFYNVVKDHTIHAIFSAVEPEPEPELVLVGITVDPKTMELFVGEEEDINSVTAIYEVKGYEVDIALTECLFLTSDDEVATVDGTTGKVKAVGEGTANILISYKDKFDTLEVTVTSQGSMEIIADMPAFTYAFGTTATVPDEFTIEIVANDDVGKEVLFLFELPEFAPLFIYALTAPVQWGGVPLNPGDPVYVFPDSLSDEELIFGVDFMTNEPPGTIIIYETTIEVKTPGGDLLCSKDIFAAITVIP